MVTYVALSPDGPINTPGQGSRKPPNPPKLHHVVSQGYQRLFTATGEIARTDKGLLDRKLLGTPVAFVERGFNSATYDGERSEELERVWARLETEVFPAARWVASAVSLDDAQERANKAHHALKTLVAMHSARSYVMRDLYERLWAEYLVDPMATVERSKLHRAFVRDYARQPEEGEIESLVASMMDDAFKSNSLFVDRMVAIHNRMRMEFLDPLHLQVVRAAIPRRVSLIFGDTPVIRTAKGRLGVNVAIGDADLMYLPLGPHYGIAFSSRPLDPMVLSVADTQKVNRLVWRSAKRYVATNPEADWRRCVAIWR